MKFTTNKIRKIFLKFFKNKKHKILPGSSLTLQNDKSLLFVNAGMNQFKDFFLGKKCAKNLNIATVQHCLRTGGKHNDINQVGITNRHHTFFEMLGNFSFGGYFKKTAILNAWELLTKKKWFNINKKKLFVSVYYKDIETYKIWKNIIKIPKNKIFKVKDKKNKKFESDNFWKMGKYGVCGPSTEIFYDKKYKKKKKFLKNSLSEKNRFLEIWNIVFIQFNILKNKKMEKLPIFSVDTGMGLERISSILQNVSSTYKTDIFKNIVKKITKLSKKKISKQSKQIIADHFRAISFIISNKVIPSNEKQGYILRKLIRRSINHGFLNNIKSPFLYKLIPILINSLKSKKNIIKKNKKKIKKILIKEELNFIKTLKIGIKIFNKKIKKIKNNKISSKFIFYLHDTLGFPLYLTKELCKEKKIYINFNKLKKKINEHKKKSKRKKYFENTENFFDLRNKKSKFIGYKKEKNIAKIEKIFVSSRKKKIIKKHEIGEIILDKTVFYPESGGQIGDSGIIKKNEKNVFKVHNTIQIGKSIVHQGIVKLGKIKEKDKVIAQINHKKRKLISINHTCTHLLNFSLKKILGKSAVQKGSFINENKIRFDFFSEKKINSAIKQKLEKIVNKKIQENNIIKIKKIDFKNAKKLKYNTNFENKYKKKKKLRSVKIGDYSKELCKGTHVKKTTLIDIFLIKKIKNISSGIKRIEAVTQKKAIKNILHQESKLIFLTKILNCNTKDIIKNFTKKIQEIKNTKIQKKIIEKKYIIEIYKNFQKKIKKNKKIFFYKIFKNIELKLLRKILNKMKENSKVIIIALINQSRNNNNIIIYVKKKHSNWIKANKIMKFFLKKNLGKGGGNSVYAEGNFNTKINQIKKQIKKIKKYILKKIK